MTLKLELLGTAKSFDGRRVRVTGGDYVYEGRLAGTITKSTDQVRVVVEDDNRRLFIHNIDQIEEI